MKTQYLSRFTKIASHLLDALLTITYSAKTNKSPVANMNMDSVVNMYKGAGSIDQCGAGFRTPYGSIFSVGVDYFAGPVTDTISLMCYKCDTFMSAKIAAENDEGFGTALSFTAPQGAHYHFCLLYGKSSFWFGDEMELRKLYIIKMPGTFTYFQIYIF